jgi:hypothetical protein
MSPFPARSRDFTGEDQMNDEVQRALPRDAPNFHQRQASHLRALAATATTPATKGRLLAKAEEHDALATMAED